MFSVYKVLRAGSCIIAGASVLASCSTDLGSATPTISEVEVSSVSVVPDSISLEVGQSTQLSASVLGNNGKALANRAVTWSSNNSSVATVSSGGSVVGIQPGSTTITARSGLQQAVATVTVMPSKPTASIAASKSSGFAGLDSTTITWISQNATKCRATGAWSGELPVEGSRALLLDSIGLLSYELTCSDARGTSPTSIANVSVTLLDYSTCSVEYSSTPTVRRLGEYLPVNSYFGDYQTLSGFQGCLSASIRKPNVVSGTISWKINLPNRPPEQRVTQGYPGLYFGRQINAPMLPSTTSKIPVRVAGIPDSANIAFDFEVPMVGQFNSLIDIDFAPTATSNNSRQVELMIITLLVGSDTSRAGSPSVNIGGIDFWVSNYGQTPHPVFPKDSGSFFRGVQFVSKSRALKGVLPIRPFVEYMLEQGWINPTDWMLDINFGFEPNAGSTTATIRSYSVNWR